MRLAPALLCLGLLSAVSCAVLKPGADPIVVRTEQLEQTSLASFQLILKTDNLDRGFWRTNAPAFHNYVEWLRKPTIYRMTNVLPRYRVLLLSLDDVKQDYKAARASSNDLYTAFAVFNSVAQQTSAWLTILSNQPPATLP